MAGERMIAMARVQPIGVLALAFGLALFAVAGSHTARAAGSCVWHDLQLSSTETDAAYSGSWERDDCANRTGGPRRYTDWFRFSLDAPGHLEVELTSSQQRAKVLLWTRAGTEIGRAVASAVGETAKIVAPVGADDYRILATKVGIGSGFYSLSVRFTAQQDSTSRADMRSYLFSKLFASEPGDGDTYAHDYGPNYCVVAGSDYCAAKVVGYVGGHSGWDAARAGADVHFYSLTSGIVEVAQDQGGIGQLTIHTTDADGNDVTVTYIHAKDLNNALSHGVNVWPGRWLGVQGSRGNATGPHVHIEVRSGHTRWASLGADSTRPHPTVDPVATLYRMLTEN